MLQEALAAYGENAVGPLAARLRFLAGLTAVQAQIAAVDRPYTAADVETIREALLTGQPIFLSAPPVVAPAEYIAAVQRVAAYVVDEAGLAEDQAEALRGLDVSALATEERLATAAANVDGFLAEAIDGLHGNAEATLAPATLAYVLTSALTPFLVGPAKATQAAAGETFDAATGTCPVCGAPAAMGLVHESTKLQGGDRLLWCGVCHSEWRYNRVQCVRCGTQAPGKLRYIHIAEDEAHRLHVCDECHGYIRTVFAGNLDKPLSFVVEDAVTAELESVARAKGYTATGDPSPAS
jgi:FdhE protein